MAGLCPQTSCLLSCSPDSCFGTTGACHHTLLFAWVLGTELGFGSSGLYDYSFYLLSHLSGSWGWFDQDKTLESEGGK